MEYNPDLFSLNILQFFKEAQGCLYSPQRAAVLFKEQYSKELNREFASHVRGRLGDLRGKKVLELGSGSGWRSVLMALAGAEVCGVEPVLPGVKTGTERSKRYPGIAVEFKKGFAEDIPYPNDSFDIVVSFQVIEHVQDVGQSVREMYRVLRKGGLAHMETGNSLFPREEHYRIFWIPYMPKPIGRMYVRLRGKNPDYVNELNFIYRSKMFALMQKTGFRNVRDAYAGYVRSKFRNPGSIKNGFMRNPLLWLGKFGLSEVLGSAIARIGFYPSLWLQGTK